MRRFSRPAPCGQSGFTYLWVLLTVALMGLGLASAVEVASTAVQRDKERQLISIGREFRAAIRRYYDAQIEAGRHMYPKTLEDLLKDPRVPGVRRHLRKIYVDPMTGRAEWGLLQVDGRIVGVYSLSTRAAIKQQGFDPDESAFVGKKTLDDWVFAFPADLLQRVNVPK